MNENETQQKFVENETLILHGLQLLKEKFNHTNSRTDDDFLKDYYKRTIPQIDSLINECKTKITNGK